MRENLFFPGNKRYSLPESTIKERKRLLTLCSILSPLFLSAFYFVIVVAISSTYLDQIEKNNIILPLIIGGIVLVCIIELGVLIAGLVGIRSLKKKELIIDEEGIYGFPFKPSFIHFKDVDEIIIERNSTERIISIRLMNKNGYFLGIEGFTEMEEILSELTQLTSPTVLITQRIRKYNPGHPIINNMRLIGRSSLMLMAYYFVTIVIVAILICILMLLGMNFDMKILSLVASGSFILTIVIAPVIRKFVVRSI